jgi:predicted NBD/HSP70 family sugar kinase
MVPEHPTGSTASLRRTHRGLALRHLLSEGGASRIAIAERLGLSTMAASRIARDLMDAGLVEEAGTAQRDSGPGRHRTLLRIDPTGVFGAGIVLSALPTEVMLVDAVGRPLTRRRVTIDEVRDGSRGVEKLARALDNLIDECGLPRARIAGVGIAVAASLDRDRRRVVGSGFLGWSPFDLVGPVEAIVGLPVRAETIANALALAETSIGAAKAMTNVAVVRVGPQIGASIVQGGQIVRGETLQAGRVGHLRHAPTALECFCGRCDCLNCSASGWAILCSLGMIRERRYTPERVTDYAAALEAITSDEAGDGADDGLRLRALQAGGEALAGALRSLCLLLEPEAIIVDGPLSRAPAYLDGIRRHLEEAGDSGAEVSRKMKRGEIRAAQAAAILPLLDLIYSPNLDFEALCRSLPLAQQGRGVRSGGP